MQQQQQQDYEEQKKGKCYDNVIRKETITDEPINMPLYCLKLDNVDKCNKLISAEIAILQDFLNQILGLQYH